MGSVGSPRSHDVSAQGALALGLALLEGRRVSQGRFMDTMRFDPSPIEADSHESAFERARSHLDACGIHTVSVGDRAYALDRARDVADPAAVDENPELVENLAHMLVAVAASVDDVMARDEHLAAAKLVRDFTLEGPKRTLRWRTSSTARQLTHAIDAHLVVRFDYEREDGRVDEGKVMDPLFVAQRDRREFLVACDHGVEDPTVKTLHLEGIRRLEVTREEFDERPVSMDRLFTPPFCYGDGSLESSSEVCFRVPAERVAATEACLSRLCCSGFGQWSEADDGSEDRIWRVEGRSPAKAAVFAIGLGIAVVSPEPYRDAYVEQVERAREAFA